MKPLGWSIAKMLSVFLKAKQIMHLFLTQYYLKDTFQDCILRHQSSNLMTLEINPFTAFTQKNLIRQHFVKILKSQKVNNS